MAKAVQDSLQPLPASASYLESAGSHSGSFALAASLTSVTIACQAGRRSFRPASSNPLTRAAEEA